MSIPNLFQLPTKTTRLTENQSANLMYFLGVEKMIEAQQQSILNSDICATPFFDILTERCEDHNIKITLAAKLAIIYCTDWDTPAKVIVYAHAISNYLARTGKEIYTLEDLCYQYADGFPAKYSIIDLYSKHWCHGRLDKDTKEIWPTRIE